MLIYPSGRHFRESGTVILTRGLVQEVPEQSLGQQKTGPTAVPSRSPQPQGLMLATAPLRDHEL